MPEKLYPTPEMKIKTPIYPTVYRGEEKEGLVSSAADGEYGIQILETNVYVYSKAPSLKTSATTKKKGKEVGWK
jgi:hypothetical protein